jgi:hypothetical protein
MLALPLGVRPDRRRKQEAASERASNESSHLLVARTREAETPGEVTDFPRQLRRRHERRRAGDEAEEALVDAGCGGRDHRPSVADDL